MQNSVYRSMRQEARSRHVGQSNASPPRRTLLPCEPASGAAKAVPEPSLPEPPKLVAFDEAAALARIAEGRSLGRWLEIVPENASADDPSDRATLPDPYVERPEPVPREAPAPPPADERRSEGLDHPFFQPHALRRSAAATEEPRERAQIRQEHALGRRRARCRRVVIAVLATCALFSAWAMGGAHQAADDRAAVTTLLPLG